MKEIPFTQYLMPDGRTREQFIERPDEIAAVAHAFIKSGGKFEIEMLPDYETVSMTAERGEVVVAHRLCSNGPSLTPWTNWSRRRILSWRKKSEF